MATTKETSLIIVEIKGNLARQADTATRSLGNLERQMTQIKNVGAQLRSVALVGIGVNVIGNAVTDLIRSVAESERTFSTLTTRLAVFEGGAEQAAVKLKELTALTERLPLTVEETVNSYLLLQSAGLAPTTEMLETLTATSIATGKSLEQIGEALSDSVVGENERLKELSVRAKDLGKTVQFSLGDAVVTVEKNRDSIKKALLELFETRYGTAVEDSMNSFTAATKRLENAQQSFYRTVAEAGLAKALTDFATELGNAAGQGEGLATVLGQTLGAALNQLTGLLRSANTDAQGFTRSLAELATTIASVYAGAKIGGLLGKSVAGVRGGAIGTIGGAALGYFFGDDIAALLLGPDQTEEVRRKVDAIDQLQKQIIGLGKQKVDITTAGQQVPQELTAAYDEAIAKSTQLRDELKETYNITVTTSLDATSAETVVKQAEAIRDKVTTILATSTTKLDTANVITAGKSYQQLQDEIAATTEVVQSFERAIKDAAGTTADFKVDPAFAKPYEDAKRQLDELNKQAAQVKASEQVPGLPTAETIRAAGVAIAGTADATKQLADALTVFPDTFIDAPLKEQVVDFGDKIKFLNTQLINMIQTATQQLTVTGQVDPQLTAQIQTTTEQLTALQAKAQQVANAVATVKLQPVVQDGPTKVEGQSYPLRQLDDFKTKTTEVTAATNQSTKAVKATTTATKDLGDTAAETAKEIKDAALRGALALNQFNDDLEQQLADPKRRLEAFKKG